MNIRRIIHNLDDDEEVFDAYHQFWLAFFWKWLISGIIFLSPFFFLYLFIQWGAIGSGLLIGLFAIGSFLLFRTWRIWYFTFIAVTNKRLVMVDQNGILDRSVSQVDLDKIYDVSYRSRGILQSLFHVGNVSITPGSFEKVELKNMRYPANIQAQIYKLQKEYGLEPEDDTADQARKREAMHQDRDRAVKDFFEK